ncbi:MAG: hypothetical protein IJT54_06235 [Candidatus Methanomethylophilaceae archaeon]|nr:hypothetical protein [Candidatus Methanomethylophilaceae archaeon]
MMIGVIFNPISRMGASTQRMKEFLKKMDEAGLEYVYRETQKSGDAGNIALELLDTCDIIMPAGGDGTVYEVVNSVWEKDVTLAILPYGSGNDVARGLYNGVPTDDQVLELLKSNSTMKVDCGLVNDQYVLTLLGSFGFGAAMLEKYLQNGGSYARTIPGLMLRCITKKYTVKINGEVKNYDTEFISVMNAPAVGGGITVYKNSTMTDGKMELVAINKKTRIRRLRNFIALGLGRLETQPNIDIIPFDECTIIPETIALCNFDGELIRFEQFHIKVYPGKLTFKAFNNKEN